MIEKFIKMFKEMDNDFNLSKTFWIGEVVDNKDPKKIGRIKVNIPELFDGIPKEDLYWIHQIMPISTGENKKSVGTFIVPGIGTKVMVIFPFNNPYVGFYFGQLLYEDYQFDDIKSDYPETYGFQNKIGDKWYINMKQETVDFYHHSGTKLHIEKNGTVDIDVVKDVNINIKGNANINVNGNADIKVDGNTTTKIGGNWKVDIGGKTDITSGGVMSLKAPKINLN